MVCKDTCFFKCNKNFSEQNRKDLCSGFWDIQDYRGQNNFIINNVDKVLPNRVYTKNNKSRRSSTLKYHLRKDNEKKRVCKIFFLSTLDLSEKKVSNALQKQTEVGSAIDDRRGRHTPGNKTNESIRKVAVDFISNLPAVPSHYCRQSTSRKYLPIDIGNLSKLYKMYQAHCKIVNSQPAGEKVFKDIFRIEFNIGFHIPKKDKCVTCERYNNTPLSDRDEKVRQGMEDHQKEKEIIQAVFKDDQARSNTNGQLCATFDLQKVLNTPHGKNNMLLYYSRKYSYLNFTIYESGTKNTYCYLWGECDGRRGSNEICSILSQYIRLVDERNTVSLLSLFCDSCPGQNKNKQIVSMLFFVLQATTKIQKITLTFLLPGHTMMPVDSVHAAIEHGVRNKTVWAPSEWPTLITNCRSKPKPYEVIVLSHTDFYDWKAIQNKLLPQNKLVTTNGEPVAFKDIRRLVFTKSSDNIAFSYDLEENATLHEIRVSKQKRHSRQTDELSVPSPVYKSQLNLPEAKFKDLTDLCKKNIIPRRYHKEYSSMPHKLSVPDVLVETDEEDDKQDYEGN